jgi:hypothetical protein
MTVRDAFRLAGGGLIAALLLALATPPALAQGGQRPPAKGAAAMPPPPPAAKAPEGEATATPEASEARVEGFRSATFGMTEAQVREAIRKDFNIGRDKITSEESPTDRTQAMIVTVPDLLPEAGPARVSYVFGHKSKKLMQVHVLWGAGQTPAVKPEKLQLAAATLQQYFLAEGFPADKVVTNARAQDGAVIVFQGTDAQKRLALLRYIAPPEGEAKEKGEKPAGSTATLWLSYVQDLQNPDVYRIPKGQF